MPCRRIRAASLLRTHSAHANGSNYSYAQRSHRSVAIEYLAFQMDGQTALKFWPSTKISGQHDVTVIAAGLTCHSLSRFLNRERTLTISLRSVELSIPWRFFNPCKPSECLEISDLLISSQLDVNGTLRRMVSRVRTARSSCHSYRIEARNCSRSTLASRSGCKSESAWLHSAIN